VRQRFPCTGLPSSLTALLPVRSSGVRRTHEHRPVLREPPAAGRCTRRGPEGARDHRPEFRPRGEHHSDQSRRVLPGRPPLPDRLRRRGRPAGAIVGLQKENLFVDEQGLWKPGVYVPAFVRRYPFIFAETGDVDQYSLCIDDDPRAVSNDQGRPLFENGQPAPLIGQALDFCRSFQLAARETDAFVKAIKAANLLVERKAETRLAAGASFTLTGFKAIDPARLRKVPARTLAQWNDKNWLAPIFAHLQSMTNWNDLMELIPAVQTTNADKAAKSTKGAKAAKVS
jgi:hypothetical protein